MIAEFHTYEKVEKPSPKERLPKKLNNNSNFPHLKWCLVKSTFSGENSN